MTNDHPLTYSIAEAAEMIPCGERWLHDQLRAGKFTGRKIQRQWRLTRQDIENIVEACQFIPPTMTPRPLDTASTRRRALEQRTNREQ
jgi:hypothetical protein